MLHLQKFDSFLTFLTIQNPIYHAMAFLSISFIDQLQISLHKIQAKKSMQQTQDPRATVVRNVAEQQQLIDEVLKQIPPIENITFDLLIDVFERCNDIREQPEFIEAIFSKTEIYEEFVLWILDPSKLIAIREKSGQKTPEGDWKRRYPNVCMRIAKENNLFYIHLYLKAYFDAKALYLWFQFLEKINVETFYTSLGYFTEIMMPFLKYEFSECTKICEELMESEEDALTSSSILQRQQTVVSKQRLLMSNKKKQNQVQKQISILALFPQQLIQFICNYIQHQPIFKFIHNLILVSLQQSDLKRSKRIFEVFLRRALETESVQIEGSVVGWVQRGAVMDVCCEYILEVLKEIYDNANTEKNYRVIFFIDSFVRLNVINIFINRIQQSTLMVKQNPDQKLTSSTDFSSIITEQQTLQYYIKSLTILVKIYSKMTKNRKTDQEIQRQSKYYGDKNSSDDQQQITGQSKVMKEFSSQINQIFTKLPSLSQLVKKSQSRIIPFSSGQNIKPISICKYQFFELLYNCLLLSKEFPESFVLNTQKINIFAIIEKRYLQESRWNNLAHKVLEKIACLLIMNNKNFFRTKEMNRNNMADQFLNTIIESFTNKKHIFLKSLRFTSQGDIHTLYTIAKAIISKLKQTYNLANFVHELDYYKKFVMNDLQAYEKKIKEVQYPADQEDMIVDNKNAEENDQVKLYVDQLSVSEIVKKIDVVSKWPQKQNKRKHGSFIHRSLSYMSDEIQSHSSVLQRRKRVPPPSQQILNTDEDQQHPDPNDTLKILIESPRNNSKSQSRDFSKTADQGSAFLKNCIKKAESVNQSSITRIEGKGLFGIKRDPIKDKVSFGLFNEYVLSNKQPHSNRPREQRGVSCGQKDLVCSVQRCISEQIQGNCQEKVLQGEKKSSLKDLQGAQDFIQAYTTDSNDLIKIHVSSSDNKKKKSSEVKEKTTQIEERKTSLQQKTAIIEDKRESQLSDLADIVKRVQFDNVQ